MFTFSENFNINLKRANNSKGAKQNEAKKRRADNHHQNPSVNRIRKGLFFLVCVF